MSKQPQTLTPSECQKLLDFLKNDRSFDYSTNRRNRNYLMALLMLDAGLRVGELVMLKVQDLYFGDHPIYSLVLRAEITKNHVERVVPLTERIIGQVDIMHAKYPGWMYASDRVYAFHSFNPREPISVRTVQKIIKKAGVYTVQRKITPHTLRHTFATRLMQKTNMRVVQRLLGHSSITSTQIYTHPNHEDLTKAIQSLE